MHEIGPRNEVATYTVEYGNPKRHGWLSNAWDTYVSRPLLRNYYLLLNHRDIVGEDRTNKTMQVNMDGQTARALNRIGYASYLPA